jgi:hypothetical protein
VAAEQLGERVATKVARSIEKVDRTRAAAWRRTRGRAARRDDLGAPPEAVVAVVAHWRPDPGSGVETRMTLLERCVTGLLELTARHVVAVVLTNEPEPTARELGERVRGAAAVRVAPAAAIAAAPSHGREILVVGWRPSGLRRRHGFYLTWAHVPLLRRAATTGRFSHLVYLEDDMRFTDRHLRYWCSYRGPLAELGLLPGFVRFERRGDERYAVDALRPVDPTSRHRVIHAGGEPVRFVNMENPYQALYVLDRELAEFHFRFSRGRSPLRSRAGEWGVRERAASGPIFDQVPKGFVSRNVVPVRFRGDQVELDPSCLIEHMAPTYSSDSPSDWFGRLRVDEVFA